MKMSIVASGAVLAVLALAGPAAAQRGASLTLYEGVNFQGPSRSFSSGIENLADQGFNDRAQSARVQGRWRLCEDSRMRGRCVDVTGDIPDLADLRLTVAVSSFENTGGGGPTSAAACGSSTTPPTPRPPTCCTTSRRARRNSPRRPGEPERS